MITDKWTGCYRHGWGQELVPEAFAHPAKVSFSLAERIYQHVIAEGWAGPGTIVIDPFSGIGGFAYHALKAGMHFRGLELEPKFVDLAAQNIALWNAHYAGRFARWGSARVLQGDSRRLLEVLAENGINLVVSSPPYANVELNDSQRWAQDSDFKLERPQTYHLAVSSPPFLQTSGGTNVTSENGPLSDPSLIERHAAGNAAAHGYGESDANIANLPEGDAPALAVSSPPYEENDQRGGHTQVSIEKHITTHGYGETYGNIGNDSGNTFWSAALEIVQQTYAVLAPGGHAVWVCKRYVRNGKIIEFSQQWAALCESVGFRVMHWHRAMLTEDHGTQAAMDGNHKRRTKARKSFFRRLAESKGSPAIDWEDVICMVKS